MKLALLVLLSFNIFAMSVDEKMETLRSVSVILEIDKDSGKYKDALEGIETFPKINWKNFNRKAETDYNEYVKTLLPYLLLKIKHEDISTQQRAFSKLMKSTQKMENFVEVSKSDKVIHNFVREKLRLEKELKACADIKTQYRDQETMMKAQLSRVDMQDKDYLVKELSDISGRIRYISGEFND